MEMVGGFAFKSSDYVPNGVPVIRIGEVNRGVVDVQSARFLPESLVEKHHRFVATQGDLLMSLNGTTGKDDYANLLLVDDSFQRYFVNQRVAALQPDSKRLDSLYLLHVLRIPKIKSQITNKSRGIRQANISNADVLELNIPLPPIQLQATFNDCVSWSVAMRNSMTKMLGKLDDLFASLQHRAFRGEL